jgi:hypothetical protein
LLSDAKCKTYASLAHAATVLWCGLAPKDR